MQFSRGTLSPAVVVVVPAVMATCFRTPFLSGFPHAGPPNFYLFFSAFCSHFFKHFFSVAVGGPNTRSPFRNLCTHKLKARGGLRAEMNERKVFWYWQKKVGCISRIAVSLKRIRWRKNKRYAFKWHLPGGFVFPNGGVLWLEWRDCPNKRFVQNSRQNVLNVDFGEEKGRGIWKKSAIEKESDNACENCK